MTVYHYALDIYIRDGTSPPSIHLEIRIHFHATANDNNIKSARAAQSTGTALAAVVGLMVPPEGKFW